MITYLVKVEYSYQEYMSDKIEKHKTHHLVEIDNSDSYEQKIKNKVELYYENKSSSYCFTYNVNSINISETIT